jgi:DnaJ-class molecular chaperone
MKWKNRISEHVDELARLNQLEAHEVLRIPRGASQDEIKKAYLALVKAYHPDVADPFMKKHNEEVLKIINASYRKLIGKV